MKEVRNVKELEDRDPDLDLKIKIDETEALVSAQILAMILKQEGTVDVENNQGISNMLKSIKNLLTFQPQTDYHLIFPLQVSLTRIFAL